MGCPIGTNNEIIICLKNSSPRHILQDVNWLFVSYKYIFNTIPV